jgi:hypothetical protein
MRVNGNWLLCEDGIARPVVYGFIQIVDGTWKEVVFLLDGGADRTVVSADFLEMLRPMERAEGEGIRLAGVGGAAGSISVETAIGFVRDDGRRVAVRGLFSVFTEMVSADMSVLGRDVTNNFSVIYDYPSQVVALLSPPHFYDIKRG